MVYMLQQDFLRFGTLDVLFLSCYVCLYSLDGLVKCILSMEFFLATVDVFEDVTNVF